MKLRFYKIAEYSHWDSSFSAKIFQIMGRKIEIIKVNGRQTLLKSCWSKTARTITKQFIVSSHGFITEQRKLPRAFLVPVKERVKITLGQWQWGTFSLNLNICVYLKQVQANSRPMICAYLWKSHEKWQIFGIFQQFVPWNVCFLDLETVCAKKISLIVWRTDF